MASVKGLIERVAERTARFALYGSAAGLFFMTLSIGWQVFGRYVLNDSPGWSESLALLLMLYFILLAAAVGVHQRFHLGFAFVADRFAGRARGAVEIARQMSIAGFGIAMVWNGAVLAEFTADHMIPTLGVSRALAYWPFILSGGMMVLFALDNILRELAGESEA